MRRRIDQDDKGFTLIELMVVVLIIAILLAVAIPTFLRVRRNAQDRAAQNSASAALKAEKAFYTNTATNNEYTDDAAELKDIEASIDYFGGTGNTCAGFVEGPKCVQVTVADTTGGTGGANQQVMLVAQSQSGTFWAVRDVARGTAAGVTNPGTYYNPEGDDGAAPAIGSVAGGQW